MAEPARVAVPFHYDQDFAAWTEEQGRALRARDLSIIDWDNVAEEIETLGRSERSEIRSRLIVLLLHLLKWEYQPEKRKTGWTATIVESRKGLGRQLRENPSLRNYPLSVLDEQYEVARLKASDETDIPLDRFPAECPYAVADILDDAFYPGSSG